MTKEIWITNALNTIYLFAYFSLNPIGFSSLLLYKTPQCLIPYSLIPLQLILNKKYKIRIVQVNTQLLINQSGIYILQDRLAVAGNYILIAITFDALTVYVNDRNSIQQISGSSIVYWVIYSWCIVAEGDSWYILLLSDIANALLLSDKTDA